MAAAGFSGVVVATPNAVDAELALSFLAERGIAGQACDRLEALCELLPRGAGCVVLAEEALADPGLPALREVLATQPPWSDVPIILVAATEASMELLVERAFPRSGNITLLQRPLNPVTLLSAVNAALRARARQVEVRDLLAQREDALRHRDEFLAMLAHELRNPLAPIRNAVYLQQKLPIADPLFVKSRDIVGRQVTHLARMVDDLLDVARLERGKMQLQLRRMDLNAAVASAVEACMPAAQAKGHAVSLRLAAEPLQVDADPVRVEQLVTNLVNNAAKFTPPGGEIAVQSLRERGQAVIAVRDNGIGMRPDAIGSLFNLFTQGDDSLARSGGGLGIGLTIVRHLVELHRGSLEAHSDGAGKGSRFLVRLPLARGAAPGPAPGAQPARPVRPRSVLVVEDNEDIRESLRMMLGLWGHSVLMAENGTQGLSLARSEHPEVALIDIGLPGMDGYEVAKAIRAIPSQAGWLRKMIAVTGYGQAADRHKALESGFDAHLLKPIEPEILERLLAEA